MHDPVAAARNDSIGLAVRRAAALWKDRPALSFHERDWTFRQIDAAADRVAAWLREGLGLTLGDRVACYGRNSDAYLLAWLGCVRGGFVHVPVNYALTDAELSYVVNQCGAKVLLHDAELSDCVQAVRRDLNVAACGLIGEGSQQGVLAAALSGGSPPPLDPPLGAADLAQIIYTSGTTSLPKGAMMCHGALLAQYASCMTALDYQREDRCLAALPLYHVAQMHAFYMPQFLVGAWTRLIESPAPDTTLRLIETEKVTSFFAPPTVWISLLRCPDLDGRDLSSLRKIYYGASIMPTPVLQELRRRLPQAEAYNAYGQTEIGVATALRPEEHETRAASAGRPVLNMRTRIVDGELRDLPPGEHGEIVHRSPQLLSGYWDKPVETAEAFAGGWFHSGDVGYMDAEGYLFVVDRVKDVINTGGVLVASREVEEVLFTHPAVSEVAVIATPDPKWIEAVAAVVVLREGAAATEQELIAYARERLAPFKTPKSVVFLDQLPKNASGKILKRELRLTVTGKAEAI